MIEMTPWDVGNARLELLTWLEIGKHCLTGEFCEGFWAATKQHSKNSIHDIVITRVKENINFTICIPGGSFWCYTRVSSMTKVSIVVVIQDAEFGVCLVSDVTREEEVLIKISALFTFSIALKIISCICLYFQLKASCICFIPVLYVSMLYLYLY